MFCLSLAKTELWVGGVRSSPKVNTRADCSKKKKVENIIILIPIVETPHCFSSLTLDRFGVRWMANQQV